MALQYLSEFCAHHEISGQCSAALATALLIPYQGRFGRLSLPMPCLEHHPKQASSASKFSIQEQAQLLPFYMSLSLNPLGMRALMVGPFYEASVTCNLVDPWIAGALETIDSIIQSGDYPKLVTVMIIRQPKIAPIWLGAVILGIETRILSPVRAGMFAVDMLSAAWSLTSHSFIGPKQQIPSHSDCQRISRAYECRLLYIAQPGRDRAPLCPWKPFGSIDPQETDLEVRRHLSCHGKHCLQYESWVWDLQNDGKSAADYGYMSNHGLMDSNETTCALLVDPQCRQESFELEVMSQVASRSVFGWLRREDGCPKEEVAIWKHDWFDISESDDEEIDGPDQSDTRTFNLEAILTWLKGLSGTL
ncbi:hypothetical protein A1O3_06128 [Capronia epimyces CBS 606.96]|uniref:Uncharacterized protein n=1 Tax=Capronia epimyces CBS 606.96 TaxID=1182542 RepID=W9XY50_9EURO|nr:uncharacterized protein A1O3_06128 [Capronia epimyces CBS 606.96]EXJ82315.1 hypothetical protein A1O3_06128 [Capronia epimyces CBS 606.96]